jgi:hypothetical protein
LAIAGLGWDTFFFFFISLLLLVAALAGVTVGTTTSAVAYVASVKSVMANLLMLFLPSGQPRAEARWWYTAPGQTFPEQPRRFVFSDGNHGPID